MLQREIFCYEIHKNHRVALCVRYLERLNVTLDGS